MCCSPAPRRRSTRTARADDRWPVTNPAGTSCRGGPLGGLGRVLRLGGLQSKCRGADRSSICNECATALTRRRTNPTAMALAWAGSRRADRAVYSTGFERNLGAASALST